MRSVCVYDLFYRGLACALSRVGEKVCHCGLFNIIVFICQDGLAGFEAE